MLNTDRAISSSKEDLLGRSSFASSLGDAIINYKNKDSIVIGLFGEWGSGKTSIINMMLEHIANISKDKAAEHKPIVVTFNPWNFSDQNQLVHQFFRQLSIELKRADYASLAKDAGAKLELYASLVEPLAFVPSVGIVALILSKVFKNLGTNFKNWGELKSRDLNLIKKDINGILEQQKNKIVVVIDDIDRLNNKEIRQIFQLVKSLGDFHNTIYFLAFDKNVIVSALKEVQHGTGREYLEKVVQVPFEVPLISKQKVEHLLSSQLDELISGTPEVKFDRVYWGNIYHGGIKYFFNNIRDVNRYINCLRYGLNIVYSEVNIIDFMAITAIQVFLPDVYYGIRDNKDIFVGLLHSGAGGVDSEKEQAKKRCDEIVSRRTRLPESVLMDILQRLFPKLESIYGNLSYTPSHLSGWRKAGRICSPENFDNFFRLTIQEGEIGQQEMETILSMANDPGAFSEALISLSNDGRIARFLERLEDYTADDIYEENIENIITVLMDIGDLFPDEEIGLLGKGNPMRILRIFYQLINRIHSKEKRYQIFRNAIEKADRSLYTIVHEIGVQDQQHGKYNLSKTPAPKEELTLNSKHLAQLEKLGLKKIKIWANDSRLSKHRHLVSILYSWKMWGTRKEIDEYINNMIKDDDGLIDFIESFLTKYHSRGIGIVGLPDYVGRTGYRIDLSNIKDFVDLAKIEERIRQISKSEVVKKLSDDKKLAVKIFLDTVDGKTKEDF